MKQHYYTQTIQHRLSPIELCSLSVFILVMTPIWLMNVIIACINKQPVFESILNSTVQFDNILLKQFRYGYFKQSYFAVEVLKGNISLFGTPLNTNQFVSSCFGLQPGLISLWQLRKLTGLAENELQVCIKIQSQFSTSDNLKLLIKTAVSTFLYRTKKLTSPTRFDLFGIKVDNVTMKQAIKKVITTPRSDFARTGYFVNVNSFNIAYDQPRLKHAINSADWVFADGSGVRLAAKYQGVGLKDNVNGTDMLPLLCKAAVKAGQSIYFLGAAPGIAQDAADNLKKQFPNLKIAGSMHGYFDSQDTDAVIQDINASGADILLVGLGSPIQEQWLHHNADKLTCRCALAVGGLFDFFSGRIPRAPLWMRELGMEWVWRLLQEPRAKFHRYVIGNPLFLYRLAMTY